MNSGKRVGRIIGLLLLLHLTAALTVPFVLLDRLRQPPGFLVNAAGSPGQVRAAVLLLFVGSAIAVGIAIKALPVFSQYSSAMALWLLATAVAGFSLQAVDNSAILSVLSLSQEYPGTANTQLFQALGVVVSSSRKWAHYSYLLVVGSWIFLLYCLLFRYRLVPRALAAFGIIGSMLQITAVTLRGLLGYAPETRLAVPLAPAYVALAVWLMVKGFDQRHLRPYAEQDSLQRAEVYEEGI